MSSPIHRILFSPPGSPPSHAASTDETDPLSTLRDLLLPIARSPANQHSNSPKVSSPLAASNGFNSTYNYPSRYAGVPRRSSTPAGPERRASGSPSPILVERRASGSPNPFEASFVVSPRPKHRASLCEGLHRRSSSQGAGTLPVYQTTQQVQQGLWNVNLKSIPRRSFRLALLLISLLAGLWILTGSSFSVWGSRSVLSETGDLSPAVMREHLVALQHHANGQTGATRGKSASYAVAGKKVVVRPGGAPSRIYAASKAEGASAPPRISRPVKSTPMTPERELLALQTYLLEDTQHAISPSVDTSEPLDPMFMLSFDIKDEHGWRELKRDVDPVVVWDIGHAWTAPVYDLLAIYAILPAPRVLVLENREDAPQIHSILSRIVTQRKADSPHPLITIGGVPIDGYEELARYHQDGLLYDMLERAGAVVDGQKEAERIEMAKRSRARPMRYGKVERGQ